MCVCVCELYSAQSSLSYKKKAKGTLFCRKEFNKLAVTGILTFVKYSNMPLILFFGYDIVSFESLYFSMFFCLHCKLN